VEATAIIQFTLAGKTVLILAAYLSPSRPLIGAKCTTCFGEGLPVLMAGDLSLRHVDWNSRLNTRQGKILRDCTDQNSCLILGRDSPTTNPYNPSVTPDVLDNVITKKLSFPVYLTSCSALRLDHLPVLTETSSRSSHHHPPYRPDFRCTNWADLQTHMEELIPFDPELCNEMSIDTCVEKFSGAIMKALQASNPKRRPREN